MEADRQSGIEDYLPKLLKHHFIVRKQNLFIEGWKNTANSRPWEALVKVDFAMNYSFLFQNEVQSAHWNRKQATIHPFHVTYYSTDDNKLQSKTYIAISDHVKHDTICFYAFQSEFIKLLKRIFHKLQNLFTFPTDVHRSTRARRVFLTWFITNKILIWTQIGNFFRQHTERVSL